MALEKEPLVLTSIRIWWVNTYCQLYSEYYWREWQIHY